MHLPAYYRDESILIPPEIRSSTQRSHTYTHTYIFGFHPLPVAQVRTCGRSVGDRQVKVEWVGNHDRPVPCRSILFSFPFALPATRQGGTGKQAEQTCGERGGLFPPYPVNEKGGIAGEKAKRPREQTSFRFPPFRPYPSLTSTKQTPVLCSLWLLCSEYDIHAEQPGRLDGRKKKKKVEHPFPLFPFSLLLLF